MPSVDGPPLTFAGPMLVQLRADNGACFEVEYQTIDFTRNEAGLFESKGGALQAGAIAMEVAVSPGIGAGGCRRAIEFYSM